MKSYVYIRMVDGAFYIGKTNNIWRRYTDNELASVIYVEEVASEGEALQREAFLIVLFQDGKLPLANKNGGVSTCTVVIPQMASEVSAQAANKSMVLSMVKSGQLDDVIMDGRAQNKTVQRITDELGISDKKHEIERRITQLKKEKKLV